MRKTFSEGKERYDGFKVWTMENGALIYSKSELHPSYLEMLKGADYFFLIIVEVDKKLSMWAAPFAKVKNTGRMKINK